MQRRRRGPPPRQQRTTHLATMCAALVLPMPGGPDSRMAFFFMSLGCSLRPAARHSAGATTHEMASRRSVHAARSARVALDVGCEQSREAVRAAGLLTWLRWVGVAELHVVPVREPLLDGAHQPWVAHLHTTHVHTRASHECPRAKPVSSSTRIHRRSTLARHRQVPRYANAGRPLRAEAGRRRNACCQGSRSTPRAAAPATHQLGGGPGLVLVHPQLRAHGRCSTRATRTSDCH